MREISPQDGIDGDKNILDLIMTLFYDCQQCQIGGDCNKVKGESIIPKCWGFERFIIHSNSYMHDKVGCI